MPKNKLKEYVLSRLTIAEYEILRDEIIPVIFNVSATQTHNIIRGKKKDLHSWLILTEILQCKLSDIYELSADEKANIELIRNSKFPNRPKAA